ncbi:MAG: hypothetical protein AB1758_31520 [Candidatus Eremiobacterota bacterium]
MRQQGRELARTLKEHNRQLEMYARMMRYGGFMTGWNALGGCLSALNLVFRTIRSNIDTAVFAVESIAPRTIYSLPGNTEVVDQRLMWPAENPMYSTRSVSASKIETRFEDGHVKETRVKLKATVGSSPNSLEVVNPDGSITVLDTRELTLAHEPDLLSPTGMGEPSPGGSGPGSTEDQGALPTAVLDELHRIANWSGPQ